MRCLSELVKEIALLGRYGLFDRVWWWSDETLFEQIKYNEGQ